MLVLLLSGANLGQVIHFSGPNISIEYVTGIIWILRLRLETTRSVAIARVLPQSNNDPISILASQEDTNQSIKTRQSNPDLLHFFYSRSITMQICHMCQKDASGLHISNVNVTMKRSKQSQTPGSIKISTINPCSISLDLSAAPLTCLAERPTAPEIDYIWLCTSCKMVRTPLTAQLDASVLVCSSQLQPWWASRNCHHEYGQETMPSGVSILGVCRDGGLHCHLYSSMSPTQFQDEMSNNPIEYVCL